MRTIFGLFAVAALIASLSCGVRVPDPSVASRSKSVPSSSARTRQITDKFGTVLEGDNRSGGVQRLWTAEGPSYGVETGLQVILSDTEEKNLSKIIPERAKPYVAPFTAGADAPPKWYSFGQTRFYGIVTHDDFCEKWFGIAVWNDRSGQHRAAFTNLYLPKLPLNGKTKKLRRSLEHVLERLSTPDR